MRVGQRIFSERVLPQCLIGCFAAGLLLTIAAAPAFACPFCSAPSQTMAEQVAQADAVCLVQWVKGEPAKDQDPGTSTYEVLQVVKSPKEAVKKGERVKLARFRASKSGDLFLVMGTKSGKDNGIEWGSPTEITEPAFQYVAQAPSPEVPVSKRLHYYMRFLEFPDQLVANDAFAEFANAAYKDIATDAAMMPREKIRQWVSRPETPQTRLGLYGMLLGLCGNSDDAKLLADKIAPNSDDFRIGIDGMISGYLLLTGSQGLDKLDDWKFKIHPGKKVAYSEIYAAMMGVRFMDEYASNRISRERLAQSMRLLLDQPDLADMVITDLARMKDWSVQDRLMSIYGKGDYNIPPIKQSIIRYMVVSTDVNGNATRTQATVTPAAAATITPEATEVAARGKKYLNELRKKDPRTVREAERFFFLK